MHRNRERGLTLIETLVTLAVLTAVMVGLYMLLDSSNKLAKQETNVAEAQQSVRIGISEVSRVVRQARVGGLFVANAILPVAPDGSSGNNSAGGLFRTDLAGIDHYIRKGTDVISVRGILSGDKYALATGDVTCGGSCASTTAMTVTIHATSATGVVNFAAGTKPSVAEKKRPFYFAVADGSTDVLTASNGTFLVPVYYVGLVKASSGSWGTLAPDSFSFTMDPTDSEAQKMTAAAPTATSLDRPFSGGIVEQVYFFVDEGRTNATGLTIDTHPSLAEATLVPDSSGNATWEIQPLISDVEDFQVAYGVDGIDGTAHDRGISPAVYASGTNADEWVGNVADEISTTLLLTSDPKGRMRVDKFLDGSTPSGPTAPIPAVAALRSVMIGLVVKSADPDFTYNGPGARGFALLDSTAQSFSAATGRPYRRRLQRFAVSLRNYQ